MSNVQPSNVQRSNIAELFPTATESAAETRGLGRELADRLAPGTVLALYGELGTGKTHLVKGLAEGLGFDAATVRSPTFTILRTYDGGTRPLHHFDAYRVQTPDEFVELGFEDYVHGDGLTVIEWAGRIESLLPPDTLRLTFTHVAPEQRRIVLGTPKSDGGSA